jgi:transcriptional regulator with XRE-family HTH domain
VSKCHVTVELYLCYNECMEGTSRGERVREARVAAGLSQAELARRSGVPQPVISAVESGKRPVSDTCLDKLTWACVPTKLRPTPAELINVEQFRLIAAATVLDPERTRQYMVARLQRMRELQPGASEMWLQFWDQVLQRWDLPEVLRLFLSDSPADMERRKVSPTAGLLSEQELAEAVHRARVRWEDAARAA